MPTRYNEPGYAHMLTFSTYHHKNLFWDDELAHLFLTHLEFERNLGRFLLFAYVVMPDHVHLVLQPMAAETISGILHGVKRGFSWQANRYLKSLPDLRRFNELLPMRRGETGYRFWQVGGGYDRIIRSKEALRKMIVYIHGNPVRKGMVQIPEEYPWSSAKEWAEFGTRQALIDLPDWWKESI
ncbi:transposase [bacterium]|nr:transposase [bacterium]